jgi:hypothetical protein
VISAFWSVEDYTEPLSAVLNFLYAPLLDVFICQFAQVQWRRVCGGLLGVQVHPAQVAGECRVGDQVVA